MPSLGGSLRVNSEPFTDKTLSSLWWLVSWSLGRLIVILSVSSQCYQMKNHSPLLRLISTCHRRLDSFVLTDPRSTVPFVVLRARLFSSTFPLSSGHHRFVDLHSVGRCGGSPIRPRIHRCKTKSPGFICFPSSPLRHLLDLVFGSPQSVFNAEKRSRDWRWRVGAKWEIVVPLTAVLEVFVQSL